MVFQLRKRNLATLEETQNNAVDVEANLLIRREKLKEEEMKNIDLEESTSLEVKLNILVSVVEDMKQNITTRNEYDVQDHGSLIEEKKVTDPKHFLSNNDCFMDQLGEERSIDLTCILDDVFYIDDLPKLYQYDDDYVLQTEANLADKSAASLWEEEVRFPQF